MRAGTRGDRVRWAIVCCVGVLLAWALVAGRLGRWRITAPMVMVFGGMIIGLLETFTGGYLSPSLRDVVPYIVLVFILMVKPYGLFGLVEIERV